MNSISIWSDIAKTPEEMGLRHPAIFPTQLAGRLIESFTRADQNVVLDPFSGMGSTGLAAERMGKTGIGLDISPDYIQRARNRPSITQDIFEFQQAPARGERRFIQADARNILQHLNPESVDLVVTSPPYWDILLRDRTADYKPTRNYGESTLDLGRIPAYEDFLEALGVVFTGLLTVLKHGSYCCVVVMDLRKTNTFYPLHADLAARLQDIGFKYDDLIIWDRRREYNNLRPLGHPSVFRVNRIHEYILILQKPEQETDPQPPERKTE